MSPCSVACSLLSPSEIRIGCRLLVIGVAWNLSWREGALLKPGGPKFEAEDDLGVLYVLI